jgi:hypothetical protein
VFDGLLEEPHNGRVLKLLFELAHWHGLAKLRMHTDTTLDILAQLTITLGDTFREFKAETCSAFATQELERERAARQRREGKKAAKKAEASGTGTTETSGNTGNVRKRKRFQKKTSKDTELDSSDDNARKPADLNLNTYKFHAMGDYVSTIQQFGTTDSYSTQSVSLIFHVSQAFF